MNSALQPVSVIIVNHNAGNFLIDCVRSALGQAEQVIVVDNDSSDGSMDMLATNFVGETRLLTHSTGQNLGFAVGCNRGLDLADQPYLLFLNPDCVLGPGSLKRLVEVLVGDSTVGMAGGVLTNPDGSEQRGGRRMTPTPWRSFVHAFGLTRFSGVFPRCFLDYNLHDQPLPGAPVDVEAISGALMLVSRPALDDVGYWDEEYFLHCEDLDWCMRFRQHGWRILFVPDAMVAHHGGACSSARPVFVEWHKHKGMIRFYRKFFKDEYPGGLMWLVVSGVLLRFAIAAACRLALLVKRYLVGGGRV